MQPLKTFGLTAAAAMALIALIAVGTASATALCKNNSSTTACTETYGSGTEIKTSLVSGTKSKLVTAFKTVECSKSSAVGKTSNAGGSTETVKESIETLTFEECGCEVKVLQKGSLEIHAISGTDNGTVTSTGTELTTSCSTIFGTIHCLYATSSTDLGTLTGGNPGKLSINLELPRLTTSAFCSEEAHWTAEYEVTSPKPLYVAGAGGGGGGEGGGATSTTLTTSLSGESKTGAEITVNEGSKVKDTATLDGTNASKATGTVKYKVYADKECKELVTSAGEVTVTSGSVPASEEKTLEAGRVYYWQAEYSGDSNNLKSTSACNEILTVKAKTTLSGTLSAEEGEELIEGEEIDVHEGTKVKDNATLGGTNHATATGTVAYKIYADSECLELIAEAGEVSVEAGEVPISEEVELEQGTYYWRAGYSGDGLHEPSEGTCGLEVLNMIAEGFWSTVSPAEAVGSTLENQKEVFEFAGNSQFECAPAFYRSEQFKGGVVPFLKVEPEYKGCGGLGKFLTQEIKSEGCQWTLTARYYSRLFGRYKDKVFLKCPGNGMKIQALDPGLKCQVIVPEQEASYFIFFNLPLGGGREYVSVTPRLENLDYEVTKAEAACNLPAIGKYGGGKLFGQFKLEVEGASLFIK